jgi:Ca-activated chloride channel homolog
MTFAGFANPLGLWGLLGLPVVLALHLLRQRRRLVPVSSLSLWSFMEIEVRGSRLQRIPLTWLLLIDLLIVVLLSLAWAQPHLTVPGSLRQARHLVILLDVSTSMRANDVLPNRFSRAQAQAISLLSNLGSGDVATVVTFGAQSAWVGDTRQVELPTLMSQVSALRPGESGHALGSALALATADLDEELPADIHIFTDAAFAEPDLGLFAGQIQWHIIGTPSANQAILEIATAPSREGETQVMAHIANFGDQPASRIITLLVDERPVDSATLQMAPNSVVSQIWTVSGRPSSLSALLIGSDALPLDDMASIGLHPDRRVRVGLVAGDPEPLKRALESLPQVDLQVLAPEDYRPVYAFDLLILRDFLPDAWPPGLVAVVDPPPASPLLPVTGNQEVTTLPIARSHPLLDGLDFSGVRWSQVRTVGQLPDDFAPLLQAEHLPLLLYGHVGLSQVYLLLFDLQSGNLTRHPAFPVLMANLVQLATGTNLPTHLRAGQPLPIPGVDDYPQVRLRGPDVDLTWASERPATWTETQEPGLLHFELVDLDGGIERYVVGVNSGDPHESDLRPRDWVQQRQLPVVTAPVMVERAINLTPWLLTLVILFMFLEARLAWRS